MFKKSFPDLNQQIFNIKKNQIFLKKVIKSVDHSS